jgi:hypothetical protein
MALESVVSHPYHELMAEAQREREIVDSPEGQALLDRVLGAVIAYSDFLDRQGLIFEFVDNGPDWPESPRLKAEALVIAFDYGSGDVIRVKLKGGAIDRIYGNGTNPDPCGLGPPDIPHKPRAED